MYVTAIMLHEQPPQRGTHTLLHMPCVELSAGGAGGSYSPTVVIVDGLLHQARLCRGYPQWKARLLQTEVEQFLGPISDLADGQRNDNVGRQASLQ